MGIKLALHVRIIAVAVFAVLALPVRAGDALGPDRAQMKEILKQVANVVEKNFYDPKMKGLDWHLEVEEARHKIDKAQSVNEMVAAIYELPRKLDDSHTSFLPPWSAVRALYGFESKAFGDDVYIYDVQAKGAAAKAGIKPGDQILDIDEVPLRRENLLQTMVYKRVLFPVDPLVLNLKRGEQIFKIELHPEIRTKSRIIDRYNRYADLWGRYVEGQSYAQKYFTFHTGIRGAIGYLDIREFPGEGSDFLSGLADTLKGSKAFVIDLRETPGGSLATLLKFLGMFEDSDAVLGYFIGRQKTTELMVHPSRPRLTGPLVVLVDSQTASAAEVTARYLQKNHKAIVLGDRSSGMVTVANFISGEVGARFVMDFGTSVAVARLALKDGEELEKKGVTPDVVCIPASEDLAQGKDPCLEQAFSTARKMIQVQ